MGKQIQIHLSDEAELNLIEFIGSRFPHSTIANAYYPPDWDQTTLVRTDDANDWIVLDSRTREILIENAIQVPVNPRAGYWRIVGRGRSCIEWSRELFPGRGRLYLNTDPNPIYAEVSALSRDNVEKMFGSAVRWIRRKCEKTNEAGTTVWVI